MVPDLVERDLLQNLHKQVTHAIMQGLGTFFTTAPALCN